MPGTKRLKLFISYCHDDEKHILEFTSHITPLKENGLIENWYDRKIIAGKDHQEEIGNNLDDADIICLFISARFLASNACMDEKKISFELMNKKGTSVVPIILSPCGWLDESDLAKILALPTDGTPVVNFPDTDTAWNNVYDGLKELIINKRKLMGLKNTEKFIQFIQSTDMLSGAHSQKGKVVLKDIFVYPDLSGLNDQQEYSKKINSADLIKNFFEYKKIAIAGENQAGKTALCKMFYLELRKKNFVPIYVLDKSQTYDGNIENRISKAFKEQYVDVTFEEIEKQRIVIILDDFHFAKRKEKHLSDLSSFTYQIIVVDDIFNINFKNEELISSYCYYKIEELSPILRNKLIKKWTDLSGPQIGYPISENQIYKMIDQKTELINTTIGKIFGKGIMPAYPFFLLSIIATYDAFNKPFDQEITSQGYCYQAFVYMYLRKQGVRNDDIDTYVNFLCEFSFLFFSKKKDEISVTEFETFMEYYLDKFNLPVNQDVMLERLKQSRLIALDDFNNYRFHYQYLYYFFVAKFLADNIIENFDKVADIVENIHNNENVYIAIFVSHHSKNEEIINLIVRHAMHLADDFQPATLSKDEVAFFTKQAEKIAQAVLPHQKETPEAMREQRLAEQERLEKISGEEKVVEDEETDEAKKYVYKCIKTGEVIGTIIKNRAGSLDKITLRLLFREAMNVQLRLASILVEGTRNFDNQEDLGLYISCRIKKQIDKYFGIKNTKGEDAVEISGDTFVKMSKEIYWNLLFYSTYRIIHKIINSLGSEKLIQIIESVCDEIDTPASYLVKHGIFMWYCKNLQVDTIAKKVSEENFSKFAQKIMQWLIVDHCSMHKVGFKERQKIEDRFHIPSKRLI